MFDKNTEWVNQEYYFYTDQAYNTQSTLELSISMSTTDFKRFSTPNLMIIIRNNNDNSRRNCNLKYIDIFDLIYSIDESKVMSNSELAFSQKISIDKKFKGKVLKVTFQKATSTDEKIVVFRIIFNESDFGTVVLPFEQFITVYSLLKQIRDNYIYISMEFPKRFINMKIQTEMENIKRCIQTLPSQISNIQSLSQENNQKDYRPKITESIREETSMEYEPSISDFDKFVDKNIDNIELPESDKALDDIQHSSPKTHEYNNDFIKKVLNNDITTFETMLMSIIHTEGSPTDLFIQQLKKYLPIDNFLPGLSEQDEKSFKYVSKYLFKVMFMNYIQNNISMPPGVPVIKYQATDVKPENIELAYDLLFLSIYTRCVRNKIESKISDSDSNKAVLNIASRCFLDILSFSFLHDKNSEIVINCLMSRFRNYNESGFLTKFANLPKQYNTTNITEKDFFELVQSVCDKMLKSGPMIGDFHKALYEKGDVKLPPENNFKIEHILNQIIDIETLSKFGNDITGKTKDEEIINLFKETKSSSKKTFIKKPVYNNALHRFISEVDFIKQIPSKYKEAFIEHVKNLKGNYDFNNTQFLIEEFGDDIIKGIYIWNEMEDKKDRYSNFRALIENCMDKQLIIAKIKGSENIEDHAGSGSDWEI